MYLYDRTYTGVPVRKGKEGGTEGGRGASGGGPNAVAVGNPAILMPYVRVTSFSTVCVFAVLLVFAVPY